MLATEMIIIKLANRVDPDEVAHHQPSNFQYDE